MFKTPKRLLRDEARRAYAEMLDTETNCARAKEKMQKAELEVCRLENRLRTRSEAELEHPLHTDCLPEQITLFNLYDEIEYRERKIIMHQQALDAARAEVQTYLKELIRANPGITDDDANKLLLDYVNCNTTEHLQHRLSMAKYRAERKTSEYKTALEEAERAKRIYEEFENELRELRNR